MRTIRAPYSTSRSCGEEARQRSSSPAAPTHRSPRPIAIRPVRVPAAGGARGCRTLAACRRNPASVAVRYCAPWSKLAAAKRRVASRPPGARCASNTRACTPASPSAPRAGDAREPGADHGDRDGIHASLALRCGIQRQSSRRSRPRRLRAARSQPRHPTRRVPRPVSRTTPKRRLAATIRPASVSARCRSRATRTPTVDAKTPVFDFQSGLSPVRRLRAAGRRRRAIASA